MQENIDIIRTDSHVNPVHGFHNFPVNAAGVNAGSFPEIFGLLRCPFCELNAVFERAEFFQHPPGEVLCDCFFCPSLCLNAILFCDGREFLFVSNLVPLRFSFSGFQENFQNLTAMIRMGSGAG